MSYFLHESLDITAHNEEVRKVMSAFHAGKPYRVPMQIYGSITNFLLNSELNRYRWSFKDYFENPEIQVRAQLEYAKWQRFNIVCDKEMGLPEEGWSLAVDFQNSYDAGWMGCPIRYFEDGVPDTIPIFEDRKEKLYEMPECLDPENGLLSRAYVFYDYMHDACKKLEFEGRPVHAPARLLGEYTDGPLDLAYKLRGAQNLLLDMLTDESYYHDLMKYITDNLIYRMKRLRELRWERHPNSTDKDIYKESSFVFADDALALISLEQYKEFVYPYHKRIFDEFSGSNEVLMHLCGDATRHFKYLRDNFHITIFDTGFPVDHGWLREELGPEIMIYGGPTVMLLKDGTAHEITDEVARICRSGIMTGGKFIMMAANNMAPCTPVENVRTMYEAVKKYGVYSFS